MIFEPGGMSRIGIEIPALNPQMLTSNHPTQPREEALGEIGVRAITAVCFGMVDPLHVESRIKHIPVRDLVCRYHAAMSNPFPGEVHALGLAQECSGQRPTATLTRDTTTTRRLSLRLPSSRRSMRLSLRFAGRTCPPNTAPSTSPSR
jgi:hypothetical protein